MAQFWHPTGVTSRQEHQPAEHADHEQVDEKDNQTAEHKAAAGQTLRRVLAQHKPTDITSDGRPATGREQPWRLELHR